MATILAGLKAHAAAATAAYPQYAGYFDGWVLREVVTSTIKTKGGTKVRRGDIVLASPTARTLTDIDTEPMVTFYDPATGHNVMTAERNLAVVEVTTYVRHRDGLVWMVGA